MKKTISITLSGMVFNIEEDAYGRLDSYLSGLKNHFGTAEYGKEVVNDIESRIAEQFSTKLKDRKMEAVGTLEVDEVIKAMGSLEDLTGESKASSDDATHGRKKLYRNPNEQVVAGVAAGLASYFNIDPIIPRIVFVLITLAGGWGILVYIILWVITPEAKTGAEKLEMKGSKVNISTLEESHKEAGAPKNPSVFRYFFREVFYLIGRFFRIFGKVILTIIGLVLTGATFVALFASSLLAIVLLFNPNSPYIDPTISQVINGSQYVMLISSAYVAAVIPILTLLLVGVSFVRRRNTFTTSTVIAFAILWLSGALTFGFIASSAAPQIQAAVKSIEQQPTMSKEFSVAAFDTVETNYDQKVKIIHGTQPKLIAYGQEKQLQNLQMQVEGRRLVISQKEDDFKFCIICVNRPLTIEMTILDLKAIQAEDSSDVTVSGFKNIADLRLQSEGAAKIIFDGTADKVTLEVEHASQINLTGSAKTMQANLSGASRLEAKGFPVETATIKAEHSSRINLNSTKTLRVDISGASRLDSSDFPVMEAYIDVEHSARVEINVTQILEAHASGASHITYIGNPTQKTIDESDAGQIEED